MPAFLAVLFAANLFVSPESRANELALGGEAKIKGNLLIPAEGLINLNGMSQEQLYKLRSDAVFKHKNLLSDGYEPSDSIFGQCESKKPWWGLWGMHVYREGTRSIEGPSKESNYILNPFRLVSAEANNIGMWSQRALSTSDLQNPGFPFLWESGPVIINPERSTAQVWYNISKYNNSLRQWRRCMKEDISSITGFSLIAYNARDFGFNYLYIDPEKSFGLKPSISHPVQIRQFLHCGGSCGYPGGCNNMSPHIPELDSNQLTQLPARAHIKLWSIEPASTASAADFTYIIDFK